MRPVIYPEAINARLATIGTVRRDLRSFRAQSAQNFRLVQICQRSRRIFVPHWEQKFGLYMSSLVRTVCVSGRTHTGQPCTPGLEDFPPADADGFDKTKATQRMPRASENS